MKLIDLLVRDFPGRGGVMCGYSYLAQDKNGAILLYKEPPALTGEDCWWADEGSLLLFLDFELSDDWNTAVITREQYEAALAAASKPVWDGEGLPPIGCECEISTPLHNAGTRVRVLCHDEGSAVCRILEGDDLHSLCGLQAKEIQPIRTAADRRREAAVDKILELMNIDRESPTRWGLDKIYNWIAEGKIPGVRLDDEAGR